jgi:hypothetical protein
MRKGSHYTDEQMARLAVARSSPDFRQKMSEIAKRNHYKPPPFKGSKHSEEARKKQSDAHKKLGYTESMREAGDKGRHSPRRWPEEKRRAYAQAQMGDKNPCWKGGVTSTNKLLRESEQFEDWRKAVFQRDDWTCQKCGIRGGQLHPHHIKRFADYPELRFDVSNGLTLCEDCHRRLHKETGGFSHKTVNAPMIGGTNE